MKSRSVAGFGMIQVMVGAVVLGIFAVVFVRKTYNKAEIGISIQLISYRDQVLDYYTALASNRISWRETRGTNWNSIATNSAIELKDVDGSGRIPSSGLALVEDNISDGEILPPTPLPTCPPTPASGKINTTHFCLTATKTGPQQIEIEIEYKLEGRTEAEMINYLVGSGSRSVSFGGATTVGTDCGTRAIIDLDFTTDPPTVTCSADPLVEPPCYRCIGALQGKCPDSGGGKTAITGFDSNGRTTCSNSNNILVAKNFLPINSSIREVSMQGRLLPVFGRYIAVQPYDCGSGSATQGWYNDGRHTNCVTLQYGNPGPDGPQGFRGPRGIIGDKGPDGFDGDAGEPGPKGPDGDSGDRGATGASQYCCSDCPRPT